MSVLAIKSSNDAEYEMDKKSEEDASTDVRELGFLSSLSFWHTFYLQYIMDRQSPL